MNNKEMTTGLQEKFKMFRGKKLKLQQYISLGKKNSILILIRV